MTDEADYFQLRDEQLRRRLSREHGLSRRDLLRLGASGSLLLAAGPSGLVARAGAQAQPASSPIVKPLPPEWFIPLGTNAEMRWEAMQGQGYLTPAERFFVRNHTSTPLIDRRPGACACLAAVRATNGGSSSAARHGPAQYRRLPVLGGRPPPP